MRRTYHEEAVFRIQIVKQLVGKELSDDLTELLRACLDTVREVLDDLYAKDLQLLGEVAELDARRVLGKRDAHEKSDA